MMSLTTIPVQKETRDKLKEFAKKSETWDELFQRLYENALTTQNTQVFFATKSYTADELLERIDKW